MQNIINLNKYPYFLLWNYTMNAEIDFKKCIVNTDISKDIEFKPVPSWHILFLKYIPFILLILLLMKVPTNLNEIIVYLITGILFYVGYTLYKTNFFLAKIYSVVIVLSSYFILFKIPGSVKFLNLSLSAYMAILASLLLILIYRRTGYRNYYKLTSNSKNTNINYIGGYYFSVLDTKQAVN